MAGSLRKFCAKSNAVAYLICDSASIPHCSDPGRGFQLSAPINWEEGSVCSNTAASSFSSSSAFNVSNSSQQEIRSRSSSGSIPLWPVLWTSIVGPPQALCLPSSFSSQVVGLIQTHSSQLGRGDCMRHLTNDVVPHCFLIAAVDPALYVIIVARATGAESPRLVV